MGMFNPKLQIPMTPGTLDPKLIIQRTGNTGERVVGASTNQAHCTDYQHQDDGEHHRIFCDVLSLFVRANATKNLNHTTSTPQSPILVKLRHRNDADSDCDCQSQPQWFYSLPRSPQTRSKPKPAADSDSVLRSVWSRTNYCTAAGGTRGTIRCRRSRGILH